MAEVMLDLETIGMPPSGAILSIGAVRFDLLGPNDNRDEFYANIDLKSCCDAGLSIDPDTVVWWLKQSDEARSSLSIDQRSLHEALADFANWIRPDDAVWGNGPDFDNVLLANAYRALGLQVPWKHWNNRCLRTLKAVAHIGKDNGGLERTGTYHNALEDARYQVQIAQLAHSKLLGMRAGS